MWRRYYWNMIKKQVLRESCNDELILNSIFAQLIFVVRTFLRNRSTIFFLKKILYTIIIGFLFSIDPIYNTNILLCDIILFRFSESNSNGL